MTRSALLLPLLVRAALASIPVTIVNESKERVSLFWIDSQTRQASLLSEPAITEGSEFHMNTFVGHEFQVREECASQQNCRASNFVIGKEKTIFISEDLEIKFHDDTGKVQVSSLMESCKPTKVSSAELAVDQFVNCVESGISSSLEKANEEVAFQAKVRKTVAGKLENYTCADDDLTTSAELRTEIWDYDFPRNVHIMHDRESSQIHVVENFISPEECQAMEETAEPKLHRATVADGKGGSQLSENRKAMQAGITVPWELEKEGDHIARLSRRVYDYTNHVLGFNISEEGQEDLMSIQYFGRGANDTKPDRYMPHCDGDCTGLPHKTGTRMATMVMYCTLPTKGGSTNFRNAGVHVVPREGNAVFFSYISPNTRKMDTGFTEHSGCPVIEGSKKIVTQWIRLGVSKEQPWDSFNTLGIQHSDANNQ